MFNERLFKAKIIEKGFSIYDIAGLLGINEVTLRRKISGKSDFLRNEMSIIKQNLMLTTEEFENIFFAA